MMLPTVPRGLNNAPRGQNARRVGCQNGDYNKKRLTLVHIGRHEVRFKTLHRCLNRRCLQVSFPDINSSPTNASHCATHEDETKRLARDQHEGRLEADLRVREVSPWRQPHAIGMLRGLTRDQGAA